MTTPRSIPKPSSRPSDTAFVWRPISELPVATEIFMKATATGVWCVGTLGPDKEVELRSGITAPEDTPEETLMEAARAAFAAVLEEAEHHPRTYLIVQPRTVHNALEAMIEGLPRIRVARPGVGIGPYLNAVHEEHNRIEQQRGLGKQPPPRSGTLTVATDASIASRAKVAGLGWVISGGDGRILDTGHRTVRVSRAGDIVTGELWAIHLALREAIAAHRKVKTAQVLVQTDSQAALEVIRRVEAGADDQSMPREHYDLAAEIADLHRRFPVEFQWVKGHSGHTANEAADRLAVLSRRNEEFKVPAPLRSRMLQAASEDIIGQLAAA